MEPDPNREDPKTLRGYSFRLIRDLLRSLGWRYRWYLPASLLISALFLLPPRLLQFFTEESRTLNETNAREFLTQFLVFGLSVAVALWLSIFLSSLLGEWLRLAISMRLREKVLGSVHNTRLETLDSAQRGDWLTRMTSDLRNCEFFLADAIPDQIQQGVLLVGAAILFLVYSGPIALVPCVFALVLAWLNVHIQHRMAPHLAQARQQEGSIFQSLIESFEGIRTIRSYRGEGLVADKLKANLQVLYQVSMRIIRRMGGLMGSNELASQIVITAVLTLISFSLVEGNLTASDVLIYPFYITLFLNAAKGLVNGAYEWNRFFIEGGRLAEICYDEEAHLPPPPQLDFDLSTVTQMEVSGLAVSYPGTPVVGDFDLALDAGKIVALVGPSGCGKSTVLEVMAGLRGSDAGQFQVHAKDGGQQCLSALPVALGAYVEQRPYLFNGSFRENLTLGLEPAEDAIWTALQKLELADLVESRGGLEAPISDRGQNLSEGQRYRLALARGLLAGRPFLLLDEPFAALDEATVLKVIEALHAERNAGVGILLVTHLLPPELEVSNVIRMERYGRQK